MKGDTLKILLNVLTFEETFFIFSMKYSFVLQLLEREYRFYVVVDNLVLQLHNRSVGVNPWIKSRYSFQKSQLSLQFIHMR